MNKSNKSVKEKNKPNEISDETYYQQIIAQAKKYKFVRAAEGQNWAGDWLVDGVPSFLVLVKRARDGGKYYVYCCGNDDLEMAIRDIPFSQAEDIFNKIQNGCSWAQLEALGLTFGG